MKSAQSENNFEVLLGFDMETDLGSFTPFHDGLRHATPKILKIFQDHAVTGTFYFVGQSAREIPESVLAVHEAGHEVGAHSLYHETLGDAIAPVFGGSPVLPHEIKPRLELNTLWIEEVTGERPQSFRCPRLFGSTTVCQALEELGYISDASYPMYYFRERLEPYHADSGDWTQCGNMRLVQIPNFADLTISSTDAYGRDCDQWPKFRTESAEALLHRIDRFLDYLKTQGIQRRVLAFYFHPWEFHPMPQGNIDVGAAALRPDPYIVKNCGPHALEQFALLVKGLKDRKAVFRTAKEIADQTPFV